MTQEEPRTNKGALFGFSGDDKGTPTLKKGTKISTASLCAWGPQINPKPENLNRSGPDKLFTLQTWHPRSPKPSTLEPESPKARKPETPKPNTPVKLKLRPPCLEVQGTYNPNSDGTYKPPMSPKSSK